ncbi:hypothetical protein PR001_g10554 [Phytophthora rubi]|uniref:Uncharacterized protein n=1 Tax=Phytophthora rubi TaxID=129364 RepID=A0A6A3MLV7_9STRA|nr:hypothetical protein PR001_g10554 [Phytophthora rubi]
MGGGWFRYGVASFVAGDRCTFGAPILLALLARFAQSGCRHVDLITNQIITIPSCRGIGRAGTRCEFTTLHEKYNEDSDSAFVGTNPNGTCTGRLELVLVKPRDSFTAPCAQPKPV